MLRPLMLAVAFFAPAPLAAATVDLEVGNINVLDYEPGVYRYTSVLVDLDSDITWTSGENITDGETHDLETYGPEPKFNREDGGIGARIFKGFADTDGPGPRGSTTQTSGSGESRVAFTPEGMSPSARYKLNAQGNLGNLPDKGDVPVVADYLARANAFDPMIVKGAQLAAAGVPRGLSGLFFALALHALDVSDGVPGFGHFSTASAVWSVIAGGVTTTVLSLAFDASGGAVVTGSPDVALYLLDTLQGPLPTIQSIPIGLSAIEALLRADIDPDGRLDAPLFFGALIPDAFSFDDADPSQEAFRVTSDGAVTAPASKVGYVPAPPAALALMTALAALGLFGAARRRLIHGALMRP